MHPATLILSLLVLTMAAFIWGGRRYEVIALCSLLIATLLGLVPFHQVFSGFSEPAVITVACVMIISKAISRTGVIESVTERLLGESKLFSIHIAILCALTFVLSGFMNNVGAMSLMLPLALDVAERSKKSPSLILMPIALSAALGGLTTLIGTPANLLISQYRNQLLGHPFSFFSFAWVGLPLGIIGLIFLIMLGWRLQPAKRRSSHAELTFAMEDYIAELAIKDSSPVIGQTLGGFEKTLPSDTQILGIIRHKQRMFRMNPNQLLRKNDILIVEAPPDELKEVIRLAQAELVGSDHKFSEALKSDDTTLIEGVIAPRSKLDNRSSTSMKLRSRYQMVLLAISRNGKTIRTRIHQTKLLGGDVVLLQGPSETIKQTASQLGVLPLQGRDLSSLTKPKALLPIGFFILAIILACFHLAPPQITFGGAIVLMVLFKSIPTRLLYEAVDWPIIILLAAMIPVGIALRTNGGTTLIADTLQQLLHTSPPWLLIGLIMLITMTLSDFMNNAATAIIMAPIAASVAQNLGVSSDPFLMSVAIGASCAFITPIGHQNNLLIMGPGGYRFSDYLRAGIPLEIIILLLGTPLILWAWPLTSSIL